MNNDSMNSELMQSSVVSARFYSGLDGPRALSSPLGRVQLSRPRTSEELRTLAEQVWRQRGLALIDPLLINDDFARQALINEANRLYGRRAVLAAAAEVR